MKAYKVTAYGEQWVDDWTDTGYTDVYVIKEAYFEDKDDALECKKAFEKRGRVEVTKIHIHKRKGKA